MATDQGPHGDKPRYPPLFPVRAVVTPTGLVVHNPRSIYLLRGALAIVLSPVIGGLMGLLAAVGGIDDGTFLAWFSGSFAAAFTLFGLVLIALSGSLSRKSTVTLDRERVVRADGASVPTAAVARVRVRKADDFGFFSILELVAANGEAFAIHPKLPMNPRGVNAVAEGVARWLNVPAEGAGAFMPVSLGMKETSAATLCYVPIQGIFLIASLWFIATDQRPFVRFAAKQSLLHFAFSIVMLVPVLALGATPVVLTEDVGGAARVVAIVWLVVLLVGYAAWNIGAHIVALVRAHRGVAWVMPWLRWIVKPLNA